MILSLKQNLSEDILLFFSIFICSVLRGWKINAVDTYGLDNDDFNTEELEEAVADIQDTLEADNYEDQLPQPEVSIFTCITLIAPFKISANPNICSLVRIYLYAPNLNAFN